jgi:menaquinone-specific isochorismate synthase
MTADILDPAIRDALARRPDIAWVHRDLALFGWGVAARLEAGSGADRYHRAMRRLSATSAPMALASFTFDENDPGSVVVIPRVLVRIDGDGRHLLIGEETDLPPPALPSSMPPGRLIDNDRSGWDTLVADALAAIGDNEVEKVVLSRRVQAGFEGPIPAPVVLSNLVAGEPGSYTYLVDGFLGSSPELLVSLAAGTARSVSLAGSADPADPAAAGSFRSDKMTREHSLAADSVELALGPFCSRLERSESGVITFGEIQHLSTSFEGETHTDTTVADLLAALHPTAAVAGTPTKSALELIRELEGHQRDRYAGPVGWFDREGDGEFAIALRCGMVDDATVTLYTGAGIVEGSDPAAEFEETGIKLRPMLRALGPS